MNDPISPQQPYVPSLQHMDSDISDSITIVSSISRHSHSNMNHLDSPHNTRLLKISNHESQISVIHDENDAEDINNEELDEYEDGMRNELQNQINAHKKKSQCPLPNLASMTSLKLDVKIKPFMVKKEAWTPSLKRKETKELCDKLDNINITVNDINHYIMNHKSSKVKNDKFIIDKLTEIQDDIEDSEMYIEENIDKKLIEYDHEIKIIAMNNDKTDNKIINLGKELEGKQYQIEQQQQEIQELMNEIEEIHKIQKEQEQQLQKEQESKTAPPPHSYNASIISSLSELNELDEKEGDFNNNNNYNNNNNKYNKLRKEHEFEMNKIKKKLSYTQKEKNIRNKKQIYNNYYKEINHFILKITQTRFKLPREVVEIISQTQQKLIKNNQKFEMEIERMQKEVNHQRLNYEKLKLKQNDQSAINLGCYEEKFIEHSDEIRSKIDELRSLNANKLQLRLDIMDIVNNNKQYHYQVFLDKFIHSLSRTFFDSNMILSTKFNDNGGTLINENCIAEADNDENEYVTEEMMSILDTIPLTITIIKVTDILSKSDNYNININDLKIYIKNIENFRLLLIENGLNEHTFYERFAVDVIHSGIIKTKKHENDINEYIDNKIKLILDIFTSIIARKYGLKLLSEMFNNDISKFIQLIIFIIKYPPIFNQIDISDYYRKKHEKNYKNIIMNQAFKQLNTPRNTKQNNDDYDKRESDKEKSFESMIKNYYDLYSNKILVKNLKKFEKYMKKHENADDSESDSDDSSSSEYEDETDTDSTDNEESDDGKEYNKNDKEEINSLMKFFNEMYEKPAKLFVKCID